MAYFVADEKLQGYYVSGGVTINIVRYHFECDDAASLPAQTAFISSKKVKISMASTAHTMADNKMYEMNSGGTWVDITENAGAYTLPPATANSLGGIMVGTGLTIDGAGVLSADGGASMPYTNHNGGIRGNNLGSSYTEEQKAAISAGTFDDIYVGDYWEISGIKYVIVDMDYYYNYGVPAPTIDHHVIVYPDKVLSAQGYYMDSNYYGGSAIYNTYLPAIALEIENKLGNFLINQYLALYDGSGNLFWGRSKCILPSIVQMQSYNQWITEGKEQHNSRQFSYFRYNADLFFADQSYWLRDSNGDGRTLFASTERRFGIYGNNTQFYLRPYFVLAGVSQ